MATKITFIENFIRKVGCLKNNGQVLTVDGKTRPINECEGVERHESYKNGKLLKPKRLKLTKK